jgi:hypothetical protein
MNARRLLFSAFAIVFGFGIIIFGGIDDSPGAQVLGLLSVICGVAGIVTSKRSN